MPETNLPRHIAIVMDGNGRWAKQRFMPRVMGHRAGVDAARRVVKHCAKRNIEVLSLFAFSSENWHRPLQEVNFLMDLFLNGLEKEVIMLHENNVQVRFIGDRSNFNIKLCNKIQESEDLTRNNRGLKLIIAADYGGQWDICQAARQIGKEIETGTLKSEHITPELIAGKLSFADLPHPIYLYAAVVNYVLVISCYGSLRILNYILLKHFWPDFDEQEIDRALEHYAGRERRFGKSSEQLAG